MPNTPFRTGKLSTMPDFRLPFAAGTKVLIETYRNHDPDDKKMDMYAEGWPDDSSVLAAAAGLVHEHFDPGGIEIDHGNGWFTTYMHMEERVPVGTQVGQGDWVGKADSIGTGAKHVHHEHLYRAGSHDADTDDMVNPVIQGEGPFKLSPKHPVTMVSTNGNGKKGSTVLTSTGSPHHGRPWPDYMADGDYFGLITGPADCHGGAFPQEVPDILAIQQQLIFASCVPGIRDVRDDWADGKFEAPTAAAVRRFRAKFGLRPLSAGNFHQPLWHVLMGL